jgi:hypothetical protein
MVTDQVAAASLQNSNAKPLWDKDSIKTGAE